MGAAGYEAHMHRQEIRSAITLARGRTLHSLQSIRARFSGVASPPRGNRAVGDRAIWFSGAAADAPTLLSQFVRDAHGRPVCLGQRVGPSGDALVVFMRHLGCPYCWSHVREWCKPDVFERVRALGIMGPFLVAPGSPAQLDRFLQANPFVPGDLMFVDSTPDFAVYRALGFGKMGIGALPDAATLRPRLPGLGLASYASCLMNMTALSPQPDAGALLAEGTMVLGGTLALRAGRVVYGWADRVPGDYPLPAEALDALGSGVVGHSAAKAA